MIEEKEISLSVIAQVIWERGKRIIAFTMICALLSGLASLLIRNRYESKAFLIINTSKLGERIMRRPTLPVQTYEDVILFPGNVQEVIRENRLDEEPYDMRYPSDLEDRVEISMDGGNAMFSISVRLENPELAADVANNLATKAVSVISKLINFEQIYSRNRIASESDKSLRDVMHYRDIYLESIKRNLKPVKIQTLNNYMTLYSNVMQQRDTLDASIEELTVREQKFKEIFSATSDYQKIIIVKKAIITNPLMLDLFRQKAGPDINIDKLNDINFVEEYVDGAYLTLYMQYQSLLTQLPGLIAKRDLLKQREKEYYDKIVELQEQIFDMDVEEMLTKGDFDRALEVFAGINKEVGWAGTTVVSERQDLVLIHPAVPNYKKVFPRRSLIVGLTGMTAFLLAFLYYLLADLYGLMTLKSKQEEVAEK